MTRHNRALIALALCAAVLVAAPLFAQGTQPAAKSKFIIPLRGDADLQFTQKVDIKGNLVITTIAVKNMSTQPIAGLKVEEFWYDKAGGSTGGDIKRLMKPLMPGEIGTLTLQDEKSATMFNSRFQFSHTYGKCKAKLVKKF